MIRGPETLQILKGLLQILKLKKNPEETLMNSKYPKKFWRGSENFKEILKYP